VVAKVGVEDFPQEHRDMVREAIESGADFYRCEACKKRWAVVRAPAGFDPLGAGPDSVVKDLVAPQIKRPGEAPTNRRHRRANEAISRRLLQRNKRLAGAHYQEDPQPRPPPQTDAERKRARNAKKKAAQEKRR